MKKLEDLRKHVIANVPRLKRNPDKLLTFIEDGNIEFWPGANLSHMYTLPIRLIVLDYAGSVDDIIILILAWLKVRERSEEHTSELQSRPHLVCRLLLEKKNLSNHKPQWSLIAHSIDVGIAEKGQLLSIYSLDDHRDLHSFPTRRSSDLVLAGGEPEPHVHAADPPDRVGLCRICR